MAAPPEKTLKNLTGKWSMNKTLSDDPGPALALQGIGFMIRKGISFATVILDINQYEAPPNPPSTSTDVVTHIDIEQVAAGLTSTHEKRCLDDTYREHADWLFGTVQGRSAWLKLDDLTDDYLKKGWEVPEDGLFIRSHVESGEGGWTATQVWGFMILDGKRMYARNLVVAKGSERVEFRLVYDYTP